MNIIDRLFRGGNVEQATAVSETDDVVEQLAGDERRKREEHADRIVRERRDREAYLAANKAKVDDYLKRLKPIQVEVNRHVVGLLLSLTDLKKLGREAYTIPWTQGGAIEEILGCPETFADQIITALHRAAPRTQWDFAGVEGPTLQPDPTFRVVMPPPGPPPGYSGVWNMTAGRPVQPGEDA